MNLFKRCNCTRPCKHPWWYRFYFRTREYSHSTRTANRTLADQIATTRKAEVLTAQEGLRRKQRPKLSKQIPAYTEWTAKTNRTGSKDPAILRRFLVVVGDKRLDQVGPFDIERWKTTRAKQVRASTVNRELNIIRGFFSRSVDWGLLTESPVRSVKSFRVDNTRVRVLSRSEIRTLLKNAPPDLALLARITLEGLLRLSEAVYLRVDDIQDDHLVLIRTKNNRVRKVPITPALRFDLMKRAHASGFVFGLDPNGMPESDGTTSVKFRRVAKSLGLERVSHHTLRHTGASIMEAAGVSLRAIQEIGGWTSLRMLERYAHPRDAEKRKAVNLMADVLRPRVFLDT